MFIVLEGIDGSGKSSLAKILAQRIGGIEYRTPPKKFKELRKVVDTTSSLQKHYEFYRDAVREASMEIGELLSQGQSVICDRYWLSTLVYHRAGMVVDMSDFTHMVQPDLTVFLWVSEVVQIKRDIGRGGNGAGLTGMQNKLNYLYSSALTESGLPFITIDTDRISLEKCADIICVACR